MKLLGTLAGMAWLAVCAATAACREFWIGARRDIDWRRADETDNAGADRN